MYLWSSATQTQVACCRILPSFVLLHCSPHSRTKDKANSIVPETLHLYTATASNKYCSFHWIIPFTTYIKIPSNINQSIQILKSTIKSKVLRQLTPIPKARVLSGGVLYTSCSSTASLLWHQSWASSSYEGWCTGRYVRVQAARSFHSVHMRSRHNWKHSTNTDTTGWKNKGATQ